MTRQRLSAVVAAVCLLATVSLRAQSGPGGDSNSGANSGAGVSAVPRLIKFSGEINPQIAQITQTKDNESGSNQPARLITVTFSLYELQEGGSPLWSESQEAQMDGQGRYTVLLGATQADGLPLDLFTSGKALWLGVQPQLPGAVEQPRVLLVAVPYALKASDSDTLGGKPASAYALAGAPLTAAVPGATATPSGSVNQQPTTDNQQPVSAPQPATPCPSITSDGTASANSLALFTTNCNLESSAITQTSGNIGISGASPANTKFQITDTPAPDSGIHYTNHELLNTSVTMNGTNKDLTFVMDLGNTTIPAGVTDSGYRVAVEGAGYANSASFAGTLGAQYGVWGRAGINAATSGATVANAYAGYFDLFNSVAGTTITNAYGVYIANSATTGTISNRYDLYASSPAGKSYFAGSVGIGTNAPTANLEVAGNLKVSGSGHGITFPDNSTQTTANFPGTGTVTSVGSGAGLAGGPITRSGTLSIAAAGVTDAMLASAYSGTGSCSAGQFVVTLGRAAAPGCVTAGTVTSVGSGAGLTGGPITGSGALSIKPLGVTNAMLLNSSLTVSAGSGLSGGGSVSLSGSSPPLSIASGGVSNSMLAHPSLSVNAGAGLTGGGSVSLGGSTSLSIPSGGVANSMLANPSLTVGTSAGSGLSGGGLVALGGTLPLSLLTSCTSGQLLKWSGSAWACAVDLTTLGTITGVTAGTDLTGGGSSGNVTLNLDTTKVPELSANNSFTGNESVAGDLSVTDLAVGDTAISALAADVSSANKGISGVALGPSGTGVFGDAENGSAAIGVWGMSASGYAGQFTGNLDVTGAITAGTKDFKIDDPVDPANKYVYHASVESSEMVNIYSGNVTLDGKGQATVQVPAWFETLNGDFRYQLSTIGGFAPVYIAQEIGRGQFKVAGGKPGMRVSWQVTGVRQDAFARAHPLQVEVEKPANERGYYIHPELYGAGQEKSIQWANHPEQMRKLAEQQAKAEEPKRQ